MQGDPGTALSNLGGTAAHSSMLKWAKMELPPGPPDVMLTDMCTCFEMLRSRVALTWRVPDAPSQSAQLVRSSFNQFGFAVQFANQGSNSAVDRGPVPVQKLEELKVPTDAAKAVLAHDRAPAASAISSLCDTATFITEGLAPILPAGANQLLTPQRLVQTHGMPAQAYLFGSGKEYSGKIATSQLGDGKQAAPTIPFSFQAGWGYVREWLVTSVEDLHKAGASQPQLNWPSAQGRNLLLRACRLRGTLHG